MRAVIYARYSSDLQREASIEDQIEVCMSFIASKNWALMKSYSDRATSGSSRFRPQYQELLAAARRNEFDIVIAEALDRLSRDQEDVAALYKALTFSGIKLITLAEGEISELHVGLKGTMNALFLKDLAAKTHRGLRGRVKEKRAAGGISYGYALKREIDVRGEPIRGGREINEFEASVVRRIFSEFSIGASPWAIARKLNGEGVPGPGGRPWLDTTIRGHAARGTGILRNELYIGRLIWNRQRFVKDPATGKRLARMNPKSEWVIEEIPELRIIEDALWEKVSSRLNAIADSPTAVAIRGSKFWEKKRPKHFLTGLAHCGSCGNPLVNTGRDYLRCTRADKGGTCANTRGIRRSMLEDITLSALQKNLMHPDLVREFVSAFQSEVNKERNNAEAERRQAERQLAETTRQLDGLITAIAEGLRAPGLQQRLDTLEQEKARLTSLISAPAVSPVRLHPGIADSWAKRIAELRHLLNQEEVRTEATEIVRSLIERVIMHPREGGTFEIELEGEIINMVEISLQAEFGHKNIKTALRDSERRSVLVVAGAGFEPTTFRL
jgi:site-specific DNA recombinase